MTDRYQQINKEDYINIAGPDWPTFEVFQKLDSIPDFIKDELDQMVMDQPGSDKFDRDNQQYLDFLSQEYLSICQGRSVLEIGANHGDHTKLIQEQGPTYQQVVEPDPDACQLIQQRLPDVDIIQNDIFNVLVKDYKFDVVVCFGVLYHLHSPLYLLEVIANYCNPDYIMLDCVNSPDALAFKPEPPNVTGNRFTVGKQKSCNFNLVVPFEIVIQSMEHLGYKLVKSSELSLSDNFSKGNSWIGLWKKERE